LCAEPARLAVRHRDVGAHRAARQPLEHGAVAESEPRVPPVLRGSERHRSARSDRLLRAAGQRARSRHHRVRADHRQRDSGSVLISIPSAVRQQIAAARPDPVYLIVGEDEVEKSALAGDFAELVEEGLRPFNVERIHAGEMTTGDRIADGVGAIVAAARTLPLMSPFRVVVVSQADALLAPKRESETASRALEELEKLLTSPGLHTALPPHAGSH